MATLRGPGRAAVAAPPPGSVPAALSGTLLVRRREDLSRSECMSHCLADRIHRQWPGLISAVRLANREDDQVPDPRAI